MASLQAFRSLLAGVLAFLGVLLPWTAPAQAARAHYTLAVVPYQIPLSAHRDWSPIVRYLSERLDADIELRVYRSFPTFEAELFQGTPDFVFMNGFHQFLAHQRHGYIPLVRSGVELRGILVVPRESPMKSVKDLNGKTIVFPSPNAFAASLFMRALLSEREQVQFTTRYLDSHNEVYRHVILSQAEAGGGTRRSLGTERPEVQAKLRVLYETPPMVSHPLAAHPRVPAAVRGAVIKAILDLNQTPDGKESLARVQLAAPLPADHQRDYQPLENLRLEKYVILGQ